jgi:hypothetical protein
MAKKAIDNLEQGQVRNVISTDAAARSDIPMLVRSSWIPYKADASQSFISRKGSLVTDSLPESGVMTCPPALLLMTLTLFPPL